LFFKTYIFSGKTFRLLVISVASLNFPFKQAPSFKHSLFPPFSGSHPDIQWDPSRLGFGLPGQNPPEPTPQQLQQLQEMHEGSPLRSQVASLHESHQEGRPDVKEMMVYKCSNFLRIGWHYENLTSKL
jgi:hypothetical protein